jgi:hypothetical protein
MSPFPPASVDVSVLRTSQLETEGFPSAAGQKP